VPRFFHVTSSLNRDSIARYGLDWRRMGATHGVAGVQGVPARPEAEGIFLCRDDWTEVQWFAEMAIDAGHGCVDVWEVQLPSDATFVAYDGSPGYEYYPESIPPEAMSLIQADWSPKSRFRD
jgi:hypothetical protein